MSIRILVSARDVYGPKPAKVTTPQPGATLFRPLRKRTRRKYAVAGALGPPLNQPFGGPKLERELRFMIF